MAFSINKTVTTDVEIEIDVSGRCDSEHDSDSCSLSFNDVEVEVELDEEDVVEAICDSDKDDVVSLMTAWVNKECQSADCGCLVMEILMAMFTALRENFESLSTTEQEELPRLLSKHSERVAKWLSETDEAEEQESPESTCVSVLRGLPDNPDAMIARSLRSEMADSQRVKAAAVLLGLNSQELEARLHGEPQQPAVKTVTAVAAPAPAPAKPEVTRETGWPMIQQDNW